MIDRDRGGSWPNRRRSNTGIIRNYSAFLGNLLEACRKFSPKPTSVAELQQTLQVQLQIMKMPLALLAYPITNR